MYMTKPLKKRKKNIKANVTNWSKLKVYREIINKIGNRFYSYNAQINSKRAVG